MTIIKGYRGGGQYGPWLELDWTVLNQETVNNRSQVRLTLYLVVDRKINFSAPKTGNLYGSSFNYSGGMRGPGTRTLATRTFWVNHNSDGTKSISLDANFNIAITWSGAWVGSISVSGTAYLPTIARRSNFKSATLTETIKSRGGGRLNLEVDSVPSGFYQWVGIYDGNTNVHGWGYSTATPTYWSITSEISKKILSRMPNQKSKDFTVRVYTYTGYDTGNLGYDTKTITANVDGDEKPSIDTTYLNISGRGWDKTNNLFVQGISKTDTTMSSTASHGTSIASERITIQGQNYNGNNITSNILNNSGTSTVTYRATDSRGNYNEAYMDLIVSPYSAPNIVVYKFERASAESVTVDYVIGGSWFTLSNKNKLKFEIKKKPSNSNSWANVIYPKTLTSRTISESGSFDGNSESQSFDFKIIGTDSVGGKTEINVTVPTAKVLFNLNKNKGVGIGKMHEKGELDVGGDVYFEGNIELAPKGGAGAPGFRLRSQDQSGHAYIEYYGPDNTRRAYIGIPSSYDKNLHIFNEQGGEVRLSGSYVMANGHQIWTNAVVDKGTNQHGSWTKFPDGTMICETTVDILSADRGYYETMYYSYTNPGNWTFPQAFVYPPALSYSSGNTNSFITNSGVSRSRINAMTAYFFVDTSSPGTIPLSIVAIGRWK